MRRPGEQLHYGAGHFASMAARLRSRGDYRAASIIEDCTGEARRWDENGRTMYATFPTSFDPNSKRVSPLPRDEREFQQC